MIEEDEMDVEGRGAPAAAAEGGDATSDTTEVPPGAAPTAVSLDIFNKPDQDPPPVQTVLKVRSDGVKTLDNIDEKTMKKVFQNTDREPDFHKQMRVKIQTILGLTRNETVEDGVSWSWVTDTHTVSRDRFPGRLYGNVGGLQSALRSVLLRDTTDVDMSAAMHRIIRWVCRQFGNKTPKLREYLKHRDEHIQAVVELTNYSKAKVKELFMMTMTSRKKLRVNPQCKFLKKFDDECKTVQEKLMATPRLQWILSYCDDDKGNLAGQFMSRVFQIVEARLVLCAKEALAEASASLERASISCRRLSEASSCACCSDCISRIVAAISWLTRAFAS